jgi:glycogen operon protein
VTAQPRPAAAGGPPAPSRLPLGAVCDDGGTSFSLLSCVAEAVELCLFTTSGAERRVPLHPGGGGLWHTRVPDVGPGQLYGYRVHGPREPARGVRCNPAKLLVDPWALAVTGELSWHPSVFDHDGEGHGENRADSAAHVPRAVVVDPHFDWGDDRPPEIPWDQTVIYEVHVKGITAAHPEVPPALRGTYAGLAHPAVLDHLRRLGVTTLSLLPVHHFVDERELHRRGLRNYWGYNPLAYLAPHAAYAASRAAGPAGAQVGEFQAMVKALHAAGLEVIIDVVFNHTCEGDHRGPTLSLRGIDNALYYRLQTDNRSRYVNWSGCGNSLDMRQPTVLRLIMDALRHWRNVMHVDGFRFDLAASLLREEAEEPTAGAALLKLIEQDPALRGAKLIAEPWDVGPAGYQLGRFRWPWAEWNDRFRDDVRDYWRDADRSLPALARRLTGSGDIFTARRGGPGRSINLVTSHDGFTLRDLVSYDDKHNLDNGHDNQDGIADNRSWNCGVEGETDDPGVLALRRRQQRNLLTTLLLSQGVPMLLGGDELGRTQRGNNNAYCQDGPLSWFDWSNADRELTDFTAALVALRHRHPQLFRSSPLGQAPHAPTLDGTGSSPDCGWWRPDGVPMRPEDWHTSYARAVAMVLTVPPGQAGRGEALLLLVNSHRGTVTFQLPPPGGWQLLLDTAQPQPCAPGAAPLHGSAAGATTPPPVSSSHLLEGPATALFLRGS